MRKKFNSPVTKGEKQTSDGPLSQLLTQVSYREGEFHWKSQKESSKWKILWIQLSICLYECDSRHLCWSLCKCSGVAAVETREGQSIWFYPKYAQFQFTATQSKCRCTLVPRFFYRVSSWRIAIILISKIRNWSLEICILKDIPVLKISDTDAQHRVRSHA